jgi:peptide methionine sulfoxide reductase MsrB
MDKTDLGGPELCRASRGDHLGHVFADASGPEGARHCIHCAPLDFDSVSGK